MYCGNTIEWLLAFFRQTRLALLVDGSMFFAVNAQAFEIVGSDPDIEMRFDNTLRYNAGWRMKARSGPC